MRMLAKEPDGRPTDGAAVVEALQAIPAERKSFVSLRPPSSPGTSPRITRSSLVRAEALLALGRQEEARCALAAARDDLLARAGRIGDLDLQESFLERRPLHARTLLLCKKWLGD